jgi:hypothetical protein
MTLRLRDVAAAQVARCSRVQCRDLDRTTLRADTSHMADSALWVAVLTGGTAVLASWVTSRGNARAARVQAEATAQAQQHSQDRAARRTAYLEFIEQAHITGELHWRLGDIYAQLTDPDDQHARLNQLRQQLRDAFDPLMRCARTIMLEGPPQVADAAQAVRDAAAEANGALSTLSQGQDGATERFDQAHQAFRLELERFIEAARTAAQSTQ